MPRKKVNVKFVGSSDVVQHIINTEKVTKSKRISQVVQEVKVEEEFEINEDFAIQKFSKELLDDSIDFATPRKSILKTPGTEKRKRLSRVSFYENKKYNNEDLINNNNNNNNNNNEARVTRNNSLRNNLASKISQSPRPPLYTPKSERKKIKKNIRVFKRENANESSSSESNEDEEEEEEEEKGENDIKKDEDNDGFKIKDILFTKLKDKKNNNINKRDNNKENITKYNKEMSENIVDEKSPSIRRKQINKSIDHYHHYDSKMSVETYFYQNNNKNKRYTKSTSNNTMKKNNIREMDQSKINSLLSKFTFNYSNKISFLFKSHFHHFDKWFYYLINGYNILLYGLGSKIKLIDEFKNKYLINYHHLVVFGFFPGLLFKHIISGVLNLLDPNTQFSLPFSHIEQVNLIKKIANQLGNPDIFLIIHNIDGFNLRCLKVQSSLSLLTSITNFHLVCSVDHINSPLLWDQITLTRLNLLNMETTTFLNYQSETSNENSFLTKNTKSLMLSSIRQIIQSIPNNAKNIFKIVCKYQVNHLTNSDNNNNNNNNNNKNNNNENDNSNNNNSVYYGMAFSDLYRKSREEFLVNCEGSLRCQLVEFQDHKLIKIKKGVDGVEYITVEVDLETIKTFLEEK